MPRAPKKCARDGCETRGTGRYCPEHQVRWKQGPSRTSTPEHAAWRKAVLDRDHWWCRIQGPGCTGRANHADHITAVAFGGAGPLGASGTRTAAVASSLPSAGGSEQVPSGAVAIAYNLTVANTGGGGHLRVYPTGSALVPASALNWPASGYTRANGSIVAISPGRQVDIYNGSPSADVLIDTLGYYR